MRWIKTDNFDRIITIQFHNFSDAFETGYGDCSHLRFVDENENIHSSLIIGKQEWLQKVCIYRQAGNYCCSTISENEMSDLIKKDLELQEFDKHFRTDNRVVWRYIANEARPFKIFVSSRVHMIQENSNIKQWKYIPSKERYPIKGSSCRSRFQ